MNFFKKIQENFFVRNLYSIVESNDPIKLKNTLQSKKLENDLFQSSVGLLHFACDLGNRKEMIQILLEFGWKSIINEKDKSGLSALHISVMRGDIESISVLLDFGSDPNVRDNDGVTPFILCKSFSGTEDIVELLLAKGANPKLTDKSGKIYLM
ncbi:MAG: ankyrin repeat domain-containing protein [Leptospiraceae bacterium]|nr:ankyrin repeat domain-containing protein [Leptospiraceae bacterium]